MMPDLPNMGVERDLESFKEFFENPAFRPDGLKVGFEIDVGVPYLGYSRYGIVRTVEEWPIPKLFSRLVGRCGSQGSGHGTTVDPSVPNPA